MLLVLIQIENLIFKLYVKTIYIDIIFTVLSHDLVMTRLIYDQFRVGIDNQFQITYYYFLHSRLSQ